MARPSIDEVMIEIADTLSSRGTCAKKRVGCVLTDQYGNILSTGYNGQPRNAEHCDRVNPCPAYLDGNLSCKAIHAEINALVRCHDVEQVHNAYVTEEPCEKCYMMLRNTPCKRVIYKNDQGVRIVKDL